MGKFLLGRNVVLEVALFTLVLLSFSAYSDVCFMTYNTDDFWLRFVVSLAASLIKVLYGIGMTFSYSFRYR